MRCHLAVEAFVAESTTITSRIGAGQQTALALRDGSTAHHSDPLHQYRRDWRSSSFIEPTYQRQIAEELRLLGMVAISFELLPPAPYRHNENAVSEFKSRCS